MTLLAEPSFLFSLFNLNEVGTSSHIQTASANAVSPEASRFFIHSAVCGMSFEEVEMVQLIFHSVSICEPFDVTEVAAEKSVHGRRKVPKQDQEGCNVPLMER